MKKNISVSITIIGIILLLVGLFTKIPSKELTTYSILEDEYSVIEEYVGGDAYNYIIGAALVGGEIAGAKTQKAIFISMGLLIACIGAYLIASSKENKSEIKEEPVTEDNSTEETQERIPENTEEVVLEEE